MSYLISLPVTERAKAVIIAKKFVVHCQKDKYDIYCGRPNPSVIPNHKLDSKYANKFVIGRDGNREECIQKFIVYAIEMFGTDEIRLDLSDMMLGCWCFPKPCHCDWLAYVANTEGKIL